MQAHTDGGNVRLAEQAFRLFISEQPSATLLFVTKRESGESSNSQCDTCCVSHCEQFALPFILTTTDEGDPWIVSLCDAHRKQLKDQLNDH